MYYVDNRFLCISLRLRAQCCWFNLFFFLFRLFVPAVGENYEKNLVDEWFERFVCGKLIRMQRKEWKIHWLMLAEFYGSFLWVRRLDGFRLILSYFFVDCVSGSWSGTDKFRFLWCSKNKIIDKPEDKRTKKKIGIFKRPQFYKTTQWKLPRKHFPVISVWLGSDRKCVLAQEKAFKRKFHPTWKLIKA